jgi:mono/diheme cytochrome c family protein
MKGACRSLVLVLGCLLGCGGEQRSAALPADTARGAATDTAGVAPTDTAATQLRDTTSAGRPESTVARTDTSKRVATAPITRKPAAKRPTPKPATPPKPATDSAAADTGQPASATGQDSSSVAANAPLRDPYHHAPLDTVPQQVYDGWKQFNLNCARCHGEDAQGTTIAPHLIVSLKPDGPINTKELFIQTVCAGRPAKGMPSWCALGMEMPTIEAIYSYVKGRSDAKIHPGRPAVRSGG